MDGDFSYDDQRDSQGVISTQSRNMQNSNSPSSFLQPSSTAISLNFGAAQVHGYFYSELCTEFINGGQPGSTRHDIEAF